MHKRNQDIGKSINNKIKDQFIVSSSNVNNNQLENNKINYK